VATFGIVVEFDVADNIAARVFAGRVLGTMDTLILKRPEERFRHGVVVADPGSADGLPEIVLLQGCSDCSWST
jgi:hypothetical protein